MSAEPQNPPQDQPPAPQVPPQRTLASIERRDVRRTISRVRGW